MGPSVACILSEMCEGVCHLGKLCVQNRQPCDLVPRVNFDTCLETLFSCWQWRLLDHCTANI